MGSMTGETRSESDQRAVYVSITAECERMHEEGDKRLMQMSTGLGKIDQQALFELLVKL